MQSTSFRSIFLSHYSCSNVSQNIEVFFCLYANGWHNMTQCNSNHSRLLGFLSALPGIWRAFQCLRRYYDTRNVFPHLVNCVKYIFTISYYLTLSQYRIQSTHYTMALLMAFATVNSIYCSESFPSLPLFLPLHLSTHTPPTFYIPQALFHPAK